MARAADTGQRHTRCHIHVVILRRRQAPEESRGHHRAGCARKILHDLAAVQDDDMVAVSAFRQSRGLCRMCPLFGRLRRPDSSAGAGIRRDHGRRGLPS